LTSGYLEDIAATSSTFAFLDGGRSVVRVTHDGGMTWTAIAPPLGGQDVGSGGLYFANSQDGWVIANPFNPAATLWRTTDGGEQWSHVWP
jgi:photosystem II stability/assembly factor-like uncharacterized protein